MTQTKILHLVDDTTPGGVTRVLDHITTCPLMGQRADHQIVALEGGARMPRDHGADFIVSHLSISWRRLLWLMRLRAREASTPLIHVEHSYTEAFTALNVSRRRRFKTLLTTAYSLFERVVAVSAAQGDWMVRHGLVAESQLQVIRSAVDVAPFLAVQASGRAPRIVGAIGRLEPQKGFDTLIAAARRTLSPGLELRIYGEGAERARLEHLAAGDTRIRFMGHADPVEAMAAVDAVAMPSRWEAYGLVALEARAAGRPLLVSPVDGLRDHIEDGAIAVDGGIDSWARALDGLSTVNLLQVQRGRSAAAEASADFADGWTQMIGDVLQGQGRAEAA